MFIFALTHQLRRHGQIQCATGNRDIFKRGEALRFFGSATRNRLVVGARDKYTCQESREHQGERHRQCAENFTAHFNVIHGILLTLFI